MLRKWFARIGKLLRIAHAKVALAAIRLQYGTDGLPADLHIGAGVRVRVTDGGTTSFAAGCSIDRHATVIVKGGRLDVGANGYIGTGAVLVARESIRIGEGVLIAEYVSIRDQEHAFDGVSPTHMNGFRTAPIVIGNNVWLGAKVTVTMGVTIGDNAVIGANSVVTRDIPANAVAAGAPARVLRLVPGGQMEDRIAALQA